MLCPWRPNSPDRRCRALGRFSRSAVKTVFVVSPSSHPHRAAGVTKIPAPEGTGFPAVPPSLPAKRATLCDFAAACFGNGRRAAGRPYSHRFRAAAPGGGTNSLGPTCTDRRLSETRWRRRFPSSLRIAVHVLNRNRARLTRGHLSTDETAGPRRPIGQAGTRRRAALRRGLAVAAASSFRACGRVRTSKPNIRIWSPQNIRFSVAGSLTYIPLPCSIQVLKSTGKGGQGDIPEPCTISRRNPCPRSPTGRTSMTPAV